VIEEHRLFCELYTDRGSHYFHTPNLRPATRERRARNAARLGRIGPRVADAELRQRPPDMGSKPFDTGCLSRGNAGGGRQRVRRRPYRPGARNPAPAAGAPGGLRQHRQVTRSDPGDPTEHICAPHGARARVLRRALGLLPGPASAGRLRSTR
jgi:hypothetical protein